jgi:PhnB protein
MATNEAVFTKDTDNKKMTVVRAFNAPLQKVWSAWTQSEILDQWWAPKPWKAGTVSMDFKEGGRWFYYMEGPEGERHYSFFNYKEIVPQKYYSGTDGFSDERGIVNTEMPTLRWKVEFKEDGDKTVVTSTLSFDKQEDMDAILKMGFEEGFKMGLSNLDEYLAKN